MSKRYELEGVGGFLEFTKEGDTLRSDLGTFKFKDNLETTFKNVQGADGILEDDFVTKRQLDFAIQNFTAVVNFDDTSPIVLAVLPVGSVVVRTFVNVTTKWNGGQPDLSIGDDNDNELHLAEMDVNLKVEKVYFNDDPTEIDLTTIKIYLNSATSTAGSCRVFMEFLV